MIFNHVNVNKFDTLEQITREDGVRFYLHSEPEWCMFIIIDALIYVGLKTHP